MHPTLLLDLDDTLLQNPTELFVPAFFRALARSLSPFSEADQLAVAFARAGERMLSNTDPEENLSRLFHQAISPHLDGEIEAIESRLRAFYRTEYPQLKRLTEPMPGAVPFVRDAKRRGWQMAIATNPVYPMTAIRQRLAWAELAAEDLAFAYISASENSHFAKPHPAYFAEILAHLGWPERPVVMVGNDYEQDIRAASALGLATYWIFPKDKGMAGGEAVQSPRHNRGDFAKLLEWLDESDLEGLLPQPAGRTAALATLQATPAALVQIGKLAEGTLLDTRPAPDAWSMTDLVGHLRDVEARVHLPRIQKMLTQDNPFLPGVDTGSWAAEQAAEPGTYPQVAREFLRLRKQTLALILEMEDTDWNRTARHAIFGPTTFLELAGIMAGHDRLHLRQGKRIRTELAGGRCEPTCAGRID